MSTAQSTLFYGVFVKTAYLCFASSAYSRIKSSLLGIDMICSRRRKGNLSTCKGHESIKRVPEEVWRMIKYETGGDAIFRAEQQVVGYHDSSHYSSDDEGEHWKPRTWNSRMSDSMNDAFWNSGGMEGMFEGDLEVRSFLRYSATERRLILSTGYQGSPPRVRARSTVRRTLQQRRTCFLRSQLPFRHQSSSPYDRLLLSLSVLSIYNSQVVIRSFASTWHDEILKSNVLPPFQRRFSIQILPLLVPSRSDERQE